MKTAVLVSLLLAWSSHLVAHDQNLIKITSSQSVFETAGHFSYLLQKDSLPVEQAVSALTSGRFTHAKNEIVKMGNEHAFVWVYVTFENKGNSAINLVLRLKNTGIASVTTFQKQKSSFEPETRWERGVYSGINPGLIKNTAPTFSIPVKANGQSEFLLLVKKNFAQPAFSVKVFRESRFLETVMDEFMWDGLQFGFYLFVIIFNLFLFVSLNDKVYIFYSCFVASSLLFYITQAGYGQLYFWPGFPNFGSYASSIFSITFMLFFLQFTQTFTGQTTRDGWLYYLNLTFKGLSVLNLLLLIYHVNSAKNILEAYTGFPDYILKSTQILAMYSVYLTGLKKAVRGDRPAQFYLAANTIYGLTLGFDGLNRWNIIDIPYLITYTFSPIGMVIEVLLLSFGLTLRYHLFKRDHDRMQIALIQKEKELTIKMIATQDAERERIAQDLHDDLGGMIATVNTRLSALLNDFSQNPFKREIKILSEIVGQAGHQIRQIAHNLMPPEFEKSGLVESVKERLISNISTKYTVSVFGNERRMLPERELNTYRILTEIFNNIQKHSGATAVSVQFLFHPDVITIVIEDDGTLVGSKNNKGNHAGIGLKNIHSRLLYLNGRMQADESDSGTTLIIDIPYDNPNSSSQ